jgi:hypothetical protein
MEVTEMKSSTRWFGWTVVLLALHMSEQLVFGIGELTALKRILAVYYGWFEQPDYGTVILVTVIATLVNLLFFGCLCGGLWQRTAAGFFGLIGIAELHHVIETIRAGHYTPGTVTAVPYVAVGILLLRALVREHRCAGNAERQQRWRTAASVAMGLLLSAPAFGQAPAPDTTAGDATPSFAESNWEVKGTFYFWLQGIHGDVNALGRNIPFRASPADLSGYANFGLSGLVDARYKNLIFVNDVLWTPLTITKSAGGPLPLPPGLTATVKFDPVVLTHEVGYRVIDSRRIKVDGLTGVRHWHLGSELSLKPSNNGSSRSGSGNWADPLAGARIQVPVTSKLTASIYGDAGGWGAGSQMDYQMVGGLNYQIKPRWAVDAGWRYLCDDYSQARLHSRTAESGLVLGVTYRIK